MGSGLCVGDEDIAQPRQTELLKCHYQGASKHEAKELYIYPKKEEILKGLKHRMRCYLSLGSPETRT